MRSSRRCLGILSEHEQDDGVEECSLRTPGYWLFMSANVKPSWSTMVPASVYFGFAASVIWVAKKDYNLAKQLEIDQPLNNCARSKKEGAVY